MDKEVKQKQLKALEQEIEEDLDTLMMLIADTENSQPIGWQNAIQDMKKTKKQLEKNLEKIQSNLDPIMQDSDEDSFMLITDKLIYDTIGEYFRYHIWTHPDMKKALQDFTDNGPNCLDNYSEEVRKWMVIFGAKKYRDDAENLEKEWLVHKRWVCTDDDPNDPFSFKNVVEYRGIMELEKLREMLDSLAEWTLEDLIVRYDIFHTTAQRKEKEMIMAQRGEE